MFSRSSERSAISSCFPYSSNTSPPSRPFWRTLLNIIYLIIFILYVLQINRMSWRFHVRFLSPGTEKEGRASSSSISNSSRVR